MLRTFTATAERPWVVPFVHQADGFDHHGDMCVGFFRELWDRGDIQIPLGARVLEVGCAEMDWLTPMKAARPDLHLTGVDQRSHPERPGADRLIQGNILEADLFAPASFEAVIAVSVLAHVGIGRYGDPIAADGDMTAMANIRRWLKPDGLLYLDVPYRPEGDSTPFRKYNEADLQTRIIGTWRVVARQQFEATHVDAPYVALVLRP